MDINDIRDAAGSGRWHPSDHADEEADNDRLSHGEIIDSVMNGEVIEAYLDDRPYPSCLVYGITRDGGPVHSVWGYNATEHHVVLITVYRPDPGRWVDWRVRR